ncbi:uncharacterized protein At3g06530 [Andrographis paniculata]|uniref:uncharacterized protein At3g06530 n=1 Tax=Andrographis paniculata TaxID=175694 RepID=UPI0021E70346|nr:uncharacterized protein At3g06530 [Andrographis paniculata]XP_051122808.1 uncharacterized protein At3g06530 [Andrographis paniculata]
MALSTISSQLRSIKDALNASTDPEPGRRRPLTRPSLLFDPRAAADVDAETILQLALSGLEVLITMEERFRSYKDDLFSQQSKELDRDLLGQEENTRINASICSYLRLLSGYLELHSAVKTLEYLIRKYKIHVYNTEDFILCALPYHVTHTFVQIVQLIDTGNSKWKFLDGVKATGAWLPREVIVQQCIRDMGVLEAICNYGLPVKKNLPSKPVVGFCTAVVFEVLGQVTVDNNFVKRILPYVSSGMQHGARRLNQKAGALMIVSLLAQKATLARNVVKTLLHSVADVAREESKERGDLQWLRMSMMTIITIVQFQSVEMIPKKTLDVLNEIRDLLGILLQLTKDFNTDKFSAVFLDSLLEYSTCDELCHQTLLGVIKTLPIKAYVNHTVARLLAMGMKISEGKLIMASSESGSQVKKILVSICQKYPSESREAFHSFTKDAKTQSNKVLSSYDLLCNIFDEDLDTSLEFHSPKLFFALESSEAETRRLGVLGLDVASVLLEKASGSKKFDAIRDALIRRIYDEDLNVVLAVLNLKSMPEILDSSNLSEALQHLLKRCTDVLLSSVATNAALPRDVALLCLQQAVTNFKDHREIAPSLATAIFPLLLIRSKTQKYNLKALELAKEIQWPFYEDLVLVPCSEKKRDLAQISSINCENIKKFTEKFTSRLEEYMPWLVKCCGYHEISKTIFFLVLFQSLEMLKRDDAQLSKIFCSFPILKNEWEMLESQGISTEMSKKINLGGDVKGILEDIDMEINDINTEVLACLFWRFSETLIATAHEDMPSLDTEGKSKGMLQDLFLFFVCHSKDIFRKHLEYLYAKCKFSITEIMLKQLTEEGAPYAAQIENLHFFSHVCSQLDESSSRKLLDGFPSFLVPLSCDNQNVRMAAMNCIEELYTLLTNIVGRNGNIENWLDFLGELFPLMIQQKKLILSDINVLVSLLKSFFSSSDSLLVQKAIGKRFDDSTKRKILESMVNYALMLPPHAKFNVLSLVKGAGSKLVSVPGVKLLLAALLKRCNQLSPSELDLLCLLLECFTKPTSSPDAHGLGNLVLEALQEFGGAVGSAIVKPCLIILRNLSSLYGDMNAEIQENIFRNLLVLFRSANGDIQNSARDTLLQINLDCSMLARVLDSILNYKASTAVSSHRKKRNKSVKPQHPDQAAGHGRENILHLLSAFLDVLLMKKDIENRASLVGPLFKLLHIIFLDNEWMVKATDQDSSPTESGTTAYIQQTLLLTVEDICASTKNDIQQKDPFPLLVSCARSSRDAVTCNHVFSLITTLVKIMPDQVSDHALEDILTAVGETTVTQFDSYSQSVFEGLISAIIPCWLSSNKDMDQLLQIFVDILPRVAEHRRLSIIKHVLRTLGEGESLGSLLFLLFCTLVSRKALSSLLDNDHTFDNLTFAISKQWEYEFATHLCEQYSCTIWLPSLVQALQKIRSKTLSENTIMQIFVARQFVADKLQDSEISDKLLLDDGLNSIQTTFGELVEEVVYHLQLVDMKKKHVGVLVVLKTELKEHIRDVLKTLTKSLQPFAYFEVIGKLIGHDDKDVTKKALGILCETMKNLGENPKTKKKGSVSSVENAWIHLDSNSLVSFNNLCMKILELVNVADDVLSNSLTMAAVSALEVLANVFPSHDGVFIRCLGSVCQRICSGNSALSSHCLRATSALVNALGPKALPELPTLVECVLGKSKADVSSSSADALFMSILLTLEAVVDKLAGFLNPYLGDILRLVVLHPHLSYSPEPKLKTKAESVRKLITEKIPVRLLLPPVLSMYIDAIKFGESSLSIVFEMLSNMVGTMDRSSISIYHVKVFDLCLQALDLRHQKPASIRNIDAVEQNVINAVVTLTKKLTETMFRPLFIKTIEWSSMIAEEGSDNAPEKAISRAIAFFGLVNKLVESHRSLFVPYFKYLLNGCVRGLSGDAGSQTGSTRKKKKAKHGNETKDQDSTLSLEAWHLRALIISSLHKCFLYDTSSLKFLDSSNFEVLLKPVVSQLAVTPPAQVEDYPDVPSVEEVDELLVACVSQMAVAAASDLLWKPLNHEVLMQTRSEKIRGRIVGLRIIKSVVEKLKEEYLIFLPETIPFVAEWLEDMEPTVRSLAQEIRKEMETLSGESLADYF